MIRQISAMLCCLSLLERDDVAALFGIEQFGAAALAAAGAGGGEPA